MKSVSFAVVSLSLNILVFAQTNQKPKPDFASSVAQLRIPEQRDRTFRTQHDHRF